MSLANRSVLGVVALNPTLQRAMDSLLSSGVRLNMCRTVDDALAAARKDLPDLVLLQTDAESIRSLEWMQACTVDPTLAEIPLVLCANQSESLLCLEELGYRCAGYAALTDAASNMLAPTLRKAMHTRVTLEDDLGIRDEVRGDLGTLGIQTLLRCVNAYRRYARLQVQAAVGQFSITLRDAAATSLQLRLSNGALVHGYDAALALMGVRLGTYHVMPDEEAS